MKVKYRRKGQEVIEEFGNIEGVPAGTETLDLTRRAVIRLRGRRAVREWESNKARFGNALVLWSYDHRLGWGAGLYDPQARPEYDWEYSDLDLSGPGDWIALGERLLAEGKWRGAYPSFASRTAADVRRARKAAGLL